MNKLPLAKRVMILWMLCEGSSKRSISRVADVSINTVTKLLVDAGEACADIHDREVRNVTAKRVQCDEIWSFCHAKQKNVAEAKKALLHIADFNSFVALLAGAVMKNVKVQSPTGDLLVNQLLTGSLDAVVAYISNAAGWDDCLDRLVGLVVASDAWKVHFDRYRREFEPVLGSQEGPPAGYKGK